MDARVAVLASGEGTNLQALLDDSVVGRTIALVVSDDPQARVLVRAEEYGVKTAPAFTLVKPSEVPVGGQSSGPPSGGCSPSGTTVSVLAPVGASGTGFEQTCYAAPAKQAFTITFDNKDTSITHNFAVYDTQGGKYIFGAKPTQLVTGPGTATYKVTPQAPGTYYFQCDVHPTLMNGTFIVR